MSNKHVHKPAHGGRSHSGRGHSGLGSGNFKTGDSHSERGKSFMTRLSEFAVVLAFVVAVLAYLCPFEWPPATYCYVLDENNQPIKGAVFVGNDRGNLVPLADCGRFLVLNSWKVTSHLYVFSAVGRDGTRTILGDGVLTKEGEEWAAIRIKRVVVAADNKSRAGAAAVAN